MSKKPKPDLDPTPDRVLIGYARVSTEDQDLTMQLDALRKAGVKDINLYSDKRSGSTTKRGGLAAALLDCRPGDVLVVWRLDRLSRSLEDLVKLSRRLADERVELRSLHEQIDTTTPMGKFYFHLMAALAEFERSLIGWRTQKGMEAAKARGTKLGAPAKLKRSDYRKAVRMLKRGESAEAAAKVAGITGSRLRQKVLEDYGRPLWTPKPRRKT